MAPTFVEEEFDFTSDAATVLLAAVKGEGWARAVSSRYRFGDQVKISNPEGRSFAFTFTPEWNAIHMFAERSVRAEWKNTKRLEEALNMHEAVPSLK